MSEENDTLEEKQNITAKQWNKLYRLDEHNGEISYNNYDGEYNIEYTPERFTTHENLNYSLGVWKESENKTWLIAELPRKEHKDYIKTIESDRPLRALTKLCGKKHSYYDLVERKKRTAHKLSYNPQGIYGLRSLKNIGYGSVKYALRFFGHRAGIELNDNFEGLKLVLVVDCMEYAHNENPAEIDRACQAAVKIMHVYGDASQFLSFGEDGWKIALTRTGQVVTKVNMKDNYIEIGDYSENGEVHMREKENIIIEGGI